MSHALAGGFLSTAPPGKSPEPCFSDCKQVVAKFTELGACKPDPAPGMFCKACRLNMFFYVFKELLKKKEGVCDRDLM